ncbi:MAG: CAP domain-containing protein [Patescibacteria group bacterium]
MKDSRIRFVSILVIVLSALSIPSFVLGQTAIVCPTPSITNDLKKGDGDTIVTRNPKIIRTRGQVTALQDFLWQYKGRYGWRIDRIRDKNDFVTGYFGDATFATVKNFQDKYVVGAKGTINYGRINIDTRTAILGQCGFPQTPPPPPPPPPAPNPPPPPPATQSGHTNEEIALLVLANEARSNPAAFGYTNPIVPPLRWSDELARAARAHSVDMAENNCYQHNSCNGQTWWKRIQAYYPGWTALAENIITVGGIPEYMHRDWMNSAGHRAHILSGGLVDFGAGIALGESNFGLIEYGTEDFGTRSLPALTSYPTLPGGTILPRLGGTQSRVLMVNYYHYNGGTPQVKALVGTSCVNLTLKTGNAAHGTYSVNRAFTGNGCTPVVFEATRSDGQKVRYPATGAILVGTGDAGASCAYTTTVTPTINC